MADVGGINGGQLRSYIERVERLQAEIHELQADKSDIFKEAKAMGFNVQALQAVIKRRAMDPDKRQELEHMEALYERAIGMGFATRAGAQEAAE